MTTPVPKRQRQRQVAAGILHFPGSERDVVPRIRRKQRPNLRHGQNRQRADHHDRPTDADLNRHAARPVRRCARSSRRNLRPSRRALRPKAKPNSSQSQQSGNFRRREDVLNRRARLHAKDIDDREKNHQQDRHQILRIDADIHVAEHHRADMNGRNFPDMPNPVRRGNRVARIRPETCRKPRPRQQSCRSE